MRVTGRRRSVRLDRRPASALIRFRLAHVLIAFAILPFFSTLLGGTAAIRLRHRLHPFMAFAAGVLVATALADLLPEATD